MMAVLVMPLLACGTCVSEPDEPGDTASSVEASEEAFDADAYLDDLLGSATLQVQPFRKPRLYAEGRTTPQTFNTALIANTHSGDDVCLRYDDRSDVDPDVAQRFVNAIVDGGFVELFESNNYFTGLFWTWGEHYAQQHHDQTQENEILDQLHRTLEPVDQKIITTHRVVLVRRIHERDAAAKSYLERTAGQQKAAAANKLAALRSLWREHVGATRTRVMMDIRKRVQRRVTGVRMKRVADRISRWTDSDGDPPFELEDFSGLDEADLVDGWGNALTLELAGDDAFLVSEGEDREPGGDGDDADLRVAVPYIW